MPLLQEVLMTQQHKHLIVRADIGWCPQEEDLNKVSDWVRALIKKIEMKLDKSTKKSNSHMENWIRKIKNAIFSNLSLQPLITNIFLNKHLILFLIYLYTLQFDYQYNFLELSLLLPIQKHILKKAW